MTPSPAATRTKKLLTERIQANRKRIREWYSEHAQKAPPPFYCSVDLRDSGHKVVPVDSNLYPAGFNNICPEDIRHAPPILKAELERIAERLGRGKPTRILILPESHTTNAFYIENLYYLHQLVVEAGFETRIGWIPESPEPVRLVSATSKELVAHPIRIEGAVLSAGNFTPDLILLNNDFSGGYPAALDAVAQPIVPSHAMGWHTRKKSEHFRHYNRLAGEFAGILGIDPWIIQIETEEVSPVDFNEEVGTEAVARAAERILAKTSRAFETHKIARKPFVFVKNNAGTYGMGIMVVHSADELRHMNRRTKNKMSVGKNRMQIASVAVQEGVPTATIVDRLAAEPVIYLVGCELIGGFLRTNTEKGEEENLNSQGMVFRKLCMSDLRKPSSELDAELDSGSSESGGPDNEPILELVYGAVARISALATGYEMLEHNRKS